MPIAGFRFAAVAAGLKKSGLDVGLAVADAPLTAAGVFTQNLVRAAPVDVAHERLEGGQIQALLVNSGCANACTGEAGLKATQQSTAAVGRALGIEPTLVVPASTGVIGEVLATEKIEAKSAELVQGLAVDGDEGFAEAIMTTDRFVKVASASLPGGASVLGIAKGAGMIHPDMGLALPPHATMLAFLFTDAVADIGTLRGALLVASELTFNVCTVDGDTSTNDCAIALASGASETEVPRKDVTEAFIDVCGKLGRMMVKDGEGASHAVDIIVRGLESSDEARAVAKTIATSALVKTAIFGKDPNWGRILGAAGRAGVTFDPKRARIAVGGVEIVKDGQGLGGEAEKLAKEKMAAEAYTIEVCLGPGPGEFTYITSDLGHGYVDVNAGYRS